MLRSKLLMSDPESRLRKALAVFTYLFFTAWLIYSQHKKTTRPPAIVKQTIMRH